MSRAGRLALLVSGVIAAHTLAGAPNPNAIVFRLTPSQEPAARAEHGAAFLPAGEVRLYRAGSDDVALTVPLNQPVSVPAGDWVAVGEAPGFVTVGAVTRLGEGGAKTVVWPAVPACEVRLAEEGWQGVSRLEVVSLDRAASYAVDVTERRRLNVPAGRFIATTVDPRGVGAISPVLACTAGAVFPLDRPQPPPAGREDVLVRAALPAGDTVAAAADPRGFAAVLRPLRDSGDGPAVAPTATVISEEQITLFFLRLPAEEPRRLVVEHPALRTLRRDVAPLSGGVVELRDLAMKPRITLEVPVDYRPAREHASATVGVLQCGVEESYRMEECEAIGEVRAIRPGVETVRFSGLDAGVTVLDTRVDKERLLGHSDGSPVQLSEEDPDLVTLPRHLVEELRIYGQLLEDGEAVAGEVRLEPRQEGVAPPRRFPTREEDLTYNLYYFGQAVPDRVRRMLPEALRERPLAERYGIPLGDYRVEACDGEGFCKPFHVWSTFTGSGRFDIDLGGGSWRLHAVDATSGEPVSSARVFVRPTSGTPPVVQFYGGKVVPEPEPRGEALDARVDEHGEARLRGLGGGSFRLRVTAPGYRPWAQLVDVADAAPFELQVALSPVEEAAWARLRFPDGEPADRAFIMAVAADGAPDYGCSRTTDALGQIDPPARCFADPPRRFFLWHQSARFQELPSGPLRNAGEIVVERVRGLPLRLRLVGPDGQPVARAPVGLRFPDLTLGPSHFGFAIGAGALAGYLTDEAGEIVFPFLAADGPLPDLWLPDRHASFPLVGPDAQGRVEVMVEP